MGGCKLFLNRSKGNNLPVKRKWETRILAGICSQCISSKNVRISTKLIIFLGVQIMIYDHQTTKLFCTA